MSWKVIPTRLACLQPKKPHGLLKAFWGGAHHHGSLSGTVPDQTLISQKSSSQVANVVGNTRRHHEWTNDSETRTCLSGCRILVKRLSGLREGQELVSPWPPVQLAASPGSNRSSFALSSFAASISLFPCPRASAGVAFHSIFVATTVQLAQGLGSWEGGGTRWRLWQLGSVGRQAAESRRTSWSVTSTSPSPTLLTLGGWKLSLMACLCSGGPVRHRHHDCEHTPCQRRSAKCPCGWTSLVRSSTTQGKDLPRTRWSSRARSFGGARCRGLWPLVS